MKILNVAQNSPEWLMARLGVVTASEIDALVSPELAIRKGKGPQTYLYRKIAEKVLQRPLDNATSWSMDQGSIIENEAIPWYAFAHNVRVDRVGLCVSDDGRCGFSPDGLIGDDGGLEIKSPQPARAVEYLLEGEVPENYRLQVQFSLYISRRKYWKFISYSQELPALVIHVEPHQETFDTFDKALPLFYEKFDAKMALIAKLKREHDGPLDAAAEKAITKEMLAKQGRGESTGQDWLREREERARAGR